MRSHIPETFVYYARLNTFWETRAEIHEIKIRDSTIQTAPEKMYIKHASRNTLNKPSFSLKWNMPLLYYRCKKWLHINIYKELVNNMTQMPRRCKTMDRLVGIIWYGQFHNKSVKSANRNPCFVMASIPPPLSMCDHNTKNTCHFESVFCACLYATASFNVWSQYEEHMPFWTRVLCWSLRHCPLWMCDHKTKIRANVALVSVTFHARCGWKRCVRLLICLI